MTNKTHDFTGTAELWLNNRMTDSVPFDGGADTVAHVIQSVRDDFKELEEELAPGSLISSHSQTFWFD